MPIRVGPRDHDDHLLWLLPSPAPGALRDLDPQGNLTMSRDRPRQGREKAFTTCSSTTCRSADHQHREIDIAAPVDLAGAERDEHQDRPRALAGEGAERGLADTTSSASTAAQPGLPHQCADRCQQGDRPVQWVFVIAINPAPEHAEDDQENLNPEVGSRASCRRCSTHARSHQGGSGSSRELRNLVFRSASARRSNSPRLPCWARARAHPQQRGGLLSDWRGGLGK